MSQPATDIPPTQTPTPNDPSPTPSPHPVHEPEKEKEPKEHEPKKDPNLVENVARYNTRIGWE